jgi:hypothetical protein
VVHKQVFHVKFSPNTCGNWETNHLKLKIYETQPYHLI